MLTKKQIEEIREHLNNSQNPLFYFDNDPDGLCSFLLLQRYIERGKGVPIKSFPELKKDYFRKVDELSADYIFILDKPMVSEEFFEEVRQRNIPVVWIDHHEVDLEKIPSFVHYYNPLYNKEKSSEPVTALCYEISQKKDDLWIAVAGSISDKFLLDDYNFFMDKYPELGIDSKNAFDIFYLSPIGTISQILSYSLKDRTTNVISMIRFLLNCNSPYDVLNESPKNLTMHKRYSEIKSKHQKFLEKAVTNVNPSSNLIFFQYGGDLSISSDLANELIYLYPSKFVVVSYSSGVKANISARGKNAKEIIQKAIEGLEGATGGGHEEAVGAQVRLDDLEIFRKKLLELLGEN